MKETLKAIQENNFERVFKFEELCPYPFDKSIIAMSFPKHFEMPKFVENEGKAILGITSNNFTWLVKRWLTATIIYCGCFPKVSVDMP